MAAFDRWVKVGLPRDGLRWSREFDVRFYVGHHADLKTLFETNYAAALDHWLQWWDQTDRSSLLGGQLRTHKVWHIMTGPQGGKRLSRRRRCRGDLATL